MADPVHRSDRSARADTFLLYPIALYFYMRHGLERQASREYLTRVLGRPPNLQERLRHFHVFAAITLDAGRSHTHW